MKVKKSIFNRTGNNFTLTDLHIMLYYLSRKLSCFLENGQLLS